MLIHKRLIRLALIPLLMLAAFTAKAEDLTEDDVKRLVRSYLLDNPEVILEAIEILQQREQAVKQAAEGETLSQLSDELIGQKGDPVGGNPNGSITLVEFFDYNCRYCKQANSTVQALIEENPDLRIVYKEFPILSETSVTAARAALAVNALYPEQYETFHRSLLVIRGSLGSDEEVWKQVARLDVDIDEVRAESKKGWIQEALARNHELARKLGITGTPTFVVGDSILRGAFPQADIQQAIEDNS